MSDSSKLRPESRQQFLTWHLLVLVLAAVVALFSRFFRSDTFGFFEDDFFYYVVAARNFALHGISTFDGIHLTNGYHPLWFLILAALLRVTTGTAFLVSVQFVALAAIVSFYLGLLEVLKSTRIHQQLLRPVALLLSLHALLLFRYGMEVTISLPLGVATVAWVLRPSFRWTGRQTFLYGLLACFTVLGRLDSILLVTLLVILQTFSESKVRWPTRIGRLAIFITGFFPFFIYIAVNRYFFGVLLPISAAAKQMKPLFPASLAPLLGLFLPFDRMKAAFVFPAIALLIAGILQLSAAPKRIAPRTRPIAAALLLFPFAQIGLLCLLSDWGVWPWYYYPLVYSSLGAFLVLFTPVEAPRLQTIRRARWALTLSAAFYLLFVSVYAVKKQPSSIALIAADLASWMRLHPGIYAMGDEAGTTAYLSDQPIIQTEGLMMDHNFLNHIRHEDALAVVLKSYGVRYYTVLYVKPEDGCYHLHEPSNAGSASPHMPGKICAVPLFTSTHSGSTASLFSIDAIQ